MIGKIINNYILERKLGDGGMGEVYYAKHNKVDREVAIKVLHSHLFNNENIHNRFKNEANALIKLNHPNIVKIFDYVEQENFACLIMEYINGYTLDDYILKISGPLPSEKAVSVIVPILEAVQYAHDNNVFHRDIKPSNIMISKDGNKVRIMDFGIAKLTDSKNFKTTHANTQLGTPFYMSPEQIKGLPFSKRSDIYSLGVTLFEMVTGKCPYHGITSLFDLQSRIVNQPLPHTAEFYPGVSQRIQNAIAIATQKDPELRFQCCADFSKYLCENTAPPISIKTSKTSYRNQSENKTYWVAYVIAGFFLIAVLGFAIRYSLNQTNDNSGGDKDTPSGTTDPPISFKVQNMNMLTTYIDTMKKKSKVFFPEKENERLISDIRKIDHPILIKELHSMVDDSFTKLLQDQNSSLLTNYISEMQEKSNVILTSRQKERLSNEVLNMDSMTSHIELHRKYDFLIVIKPPPPVKPPVEPPTKIQIIQDFWVIIYQRKEYGRVLFEDKSQLSGIDIVDFKLDTKNPPNEIQIQVNFTISPVDDESEKVPCFVKLRYSKSGNSYTLIN